MYALIAVPTLLFIAWAISRHGRLERQARSDAHWIAEHRRFDADHRLSRQMHGDAMWSAIADRDRREAARRQGLRRIR